MSKWAQRAKKYAREASLKKNKNRFGKWTKLACKRFLKDIKRTTRRNPPFVFNPQQVDRVCEYMSNLPHVEGDWGSKTIILEDFQVFLLANLFGFRKSDGSRRFTSALLAIARKNAKSTLAAGIGLYCLTMEQENSPQTISAATTGDQAYIVFNIARRMVDRTPDMKNAFNMQAFMRAIACYDNGGIMKPINAKASTQDGLNPSCVILDEIHAHKTGDLLNVLQTAAGARKNPLYLFTTTEGYESPGPWPEMRKFAHQVLEEAVEADHFFALIYAIDKDDDEFDSKVWEKANPLLRSNPKLLDTIKKEAREAKAMPGRRAEFLIKRVNRQSAPAEGWIDLLKWKKCAGPVDLEILKDHPCYGGLDLASTRDLTSFRLVWLVDDVVYTHGWRWVPVVTVEQRKQRNLVPYPAWVQSGYMIETPGEVTDYEFIFKQIMEVKDNFKLVKIAYDTWNSAQIAARISKENVDMQQFIQGPKSYHPPMKFFEESYLAGRFRHGGDPVLTWCASNLVPRLDQNTNMAPDKKRSSDKIDDMTALLMAIGVIIDDKDETSDLDSFLDDPLIFK